jgi:hypothetical protein
MSSVPFTTTLHSYAFITVAVCTPCFTLPRSQAGPYKQPARLTQGSYGLCLFAHTSTYS